MNLKRLLIVMLLLFIPFIIIAETCDNTKISITSINLKNKNETVTEESNATISNNSIDLNIMMSTPGDFAEYEMVVNNDSDSDYLLNKDSFNLSSNYIDYTFNTEGNDTTIEAHTNETVYLTIEYKNKVPDTAYSSGYFIDNKIMTVDLSTGEVEDITPEVNETNNTVIETNTTNETNETNETFIEKLINPKTGVTNYAIFFVIIILIAIATYLATFKKKNTELLILLIGVSLIPIYIHAICIYDIKVDSSVKIKRNYNPCTYDGELISGAQYRNGQYIYVYGLYEWYDFSAEGWGMYVYDWDDTINTKMCTSINGKPIVSMSGTFLQSTAREIDLSSFDTSNVIVMDAMFAAATYVETLDLSSFDTSNVVNMASMFSGNYELKELNISSFDTSNVREMSSMFRATPLTSLDLSNFNTSNVEDMSYMFAFSDKLVNLNLRSFDTSNVETMGSMFYGCSSLENLDLSSFRTQNVRSMSEMFKECSSLKSIDLSHFDTSEVNNMSYLFYKCSSLTNVNLSGINTSKVKNMKFMFYNCSSLNNLNLSSFNTSIVETMESMFYGCSSLENLDLSNFNTSKVTEMSGMFSGCSSLTNLDISNFNTSKVKSMCTMFMNTGLSVLDLRHFDISSLNAGDNGTRSMFAGAAATIGYAKDQTIADRFNSSKNKPSTLTFEVPLVD